MKMDEPKMDKIIYKKIVLNIPISSAYKYFTENDLLEQWLALKADVDPIIGGKFELFWDIENLQQDSTIGCRLLIVDSEKILNFEWKGPSQFAKLMNEERPLTNVTVFFSEGVASTEINLIHTGWGTNEAWEEARKWFGSAWGIALDRLVEICNGRTEAIIE